MIKKIFAITGNRAEYGLLKEVTLKLEKSPKIDFSLIITGSHLDSKFGKTIEEISQDSFNSIYKIPCIKSHQIQNRVGIEVSSLIMNFTKFFTKKRPDLILLLGDRYESFAVAICASILKIPIAHIYGGETTQGAYDESFRHSISKMAHLHFVANKTYKKRLIQLGENIDNIHVIGSLAFENINKKQLIDKSKIEELLKIDLNHKTFIVTYHPETLSNISINTQIKNLLNAIEKFNDIQFIFTKSNSDTGGEIVNKAIENFVLRHKNTSLFDSLGHELYFSLLKHVVGVIGNSSSGLSEVPYLGRMTINIGSRQEGRPKVSSIIDTNHDLRSIFNSIKFALENEIDSFNEIINIYGQGGSSAKVVNVIEETNLTNLLQKKFYDISF